MSEVAKQTARPWFWWAVAVGLLPLSFLMWVFGLQGAWSDRPEPTLGTSICAVLLILSPAVALAGVIWIVVLCVLADRRQAARRIEDQNRAR
jgi:hypothetical protein